MDPVEVILKKYWGYEAFRPLQKEIILSAIKKNDTLALLPTGGGKSICFQVPALSMEGICLVVTPLIALMKDQVEQLKKRDIPALAIYSGMSYKEIDIVLDRCVYDNIKFLYLSPERLKTDLFKERLKKMNVSILAVDEAHCISQWGYDFRPSYLEIAALRENLPSVPVIALTASATPEVADDIQNKLLFRKKNLFKKSFIRDNLSYHCVFEENKERKIVHILNKLPGTAIIYVRSRIRAQKISDLLLANRISSSFYHAGITNEKRSKIQAAWIDGTVRVIVATNAFGMGIDKSNVRLVIHIDIPENLESYYQEAGRAGRDGKKAFAVMLYQQKDIIDLREKLAQSYPEISFVKKVYQSLANYYKLAVGSSQYASYNFDTDEFIRIYGYHKKEVFNALKILEKENLIQLTTAFYEPSKIFFTINGEQLYQYQVSHENHDSFIKGLLRMYGGEAFTNYISINERSIATTLQLMESEVRNKLISMDKNGVIIYQQQKDKPQLTFLTPRFDAPELPIDSKRLLGRKSRDEQKLEAIIHYCFQTNICRNIILVDYFGEKIDLDCGICDVCRRKKKEYNIMSPSLVHKIKNILSIKSLPVDELCMQFNAQLKDEVIKVLREMIDLQILELDKKGYVAIKESQK